MHRRLAATVALVLAMVGFLPMGLAGTASAANRSHFAAPFSQWVGAHPVDSADCPIGTCYGPLVESKPVRPEFSFVQTMRRRVVGYDQALRRNTSVLAAELQVVEQLPADVSIPRSVTVIHHDRYGHSCAVLDLYSPSLAKQFGSKGLAGQGNSIGVELATVGPGGLAQYRANAIDLAIIVPDYLDSSTNC